MENAGQHLALKKIVSPKGWGGAFGRNHTAAKESHAGSASFDAGPSPLAHAKGPVAPRNGFAVGNLKARTRGSRSPDSYAFRGLHGSGGEAVAVFANQFTGQHRKARQVGG
jgi:hypothetical protein